MLLRFRGEGVWGACCRRLAEIFSTTSFESRYYSFSISVVLKLKTSTTDIPFLYYCVFSLLTRFPKTSCFGFSGFSVGNNQFLPRGARVYAEVL